MAFRDLIDVGQQCKRLLDAGRVQTLERMGFDVELLVRWTVPLSALLIIFSAQHFPHPSIPANPFPILQLYTEADITPENVLLVAVPKKVV